MSGARIQSLYFQAGIKLLIGTTNRKSLQPALGMAAVTNHAYFILKVDNHYSEAPVKDLILWLICESFRPLVFSYDSESLKPGFSHQSH